MGYSSRQDAARRRLNKKFGEREGQGDAVLAGGALAAVASTVARRGPLSDEQAYAEVQAETELMRRERREHSTADAAHRK